MSLKSFLIATLVIFFSLISFSAAADWQIKSQKVKNNPQDIVVHLTENDIETACLSITLANGMSQAKHKNVTIFASLDGTLLGIADEIKNAVCTVPDGAGGVMQVTLQQNLLSFLDAGEGTDDLGHLILDHDRLVLCPLCYGARYEQIPDYGVLPGAPEEFGDHVAPGDAIMTLMFDADKVIDF